MAAAAAALLLRLLLSLLPLVWGPPAPLSAVCSSLLSLLTPSCLPSFAAPLFCLERCEQRPPPFYLILYFLSLFWSAGGGDKYFIFASPSRWR